MSYKPKFCKDCKYSPEMTCRSKSQTFYEFATCHHKKGSATNLVNGQSYRRLCSAMRHDEDFCGYEGVFFELKTA